MTIETHHRDYFEYLRQQARTAVARGELEDGLRICEEAQLWAQHHGDQTDVDFTSCSRDAILLHMGRGDLVLRDLQKILMRSPNATNRHLAAYNLSNYYDQHEDFEKSRFYAQIALDHAKKTDSDFYVARSYNRLANLLIRNSEFTEASEFYRLAYDLFAVDDVELIERLTLLLNIGYCNLVCGNVGEGFENLFTVRRQFIRNRIRQGSVLGRLRLSFCFGYLEIEKAHPAKRHGAAGLAIAEECGDRDLIKKALYLLGEAEKKADDEFAAYTYFARLQEEYYPDNPYLPELLLGCDTNRMVNLWA